MTGLLLEWAGLLGMFLAGWILRGALVRPERTEEEAEADRRAERNRLDHVRRN